MRTSLAGTFGIGLAGSVSAPLQAAEPVCGEALLPQDDPDPRGRRRRLARARLRYTYDYGKVATLPMLENVPLSEQFSVPWLLQASARVFDLIQNFAAPGGAAGNPRARAWRRVARMLAAGGADGSAAGRLIDLARQAASAQAGPDRPESLGDYDALIRTIARPAVAETFQDDRVFARQRVAGANPLVIRQTGALDDRFPVTEAMYQSILPNDQMEAAGQEGRLFLADYRDLGAAQEGLYRGVPKFVSAPLALFAVEKGRASSFPSPSSASRSPDPTTRSSRRTTATPG